MTRRVVLHASTNAFKSDKGVNLASFVLPIIRAKTTPCPNLGCLQCRLRESQTTIRFQNGSNRHCLVRHKFTECEIVRAVFARRCSLVVKETNTIIFIFRYRNCDASCNRFSSIHDFHLQIGFLEIAFK